MSISDAFPTPAHPDPRRGEPSWDLALQYPLQGAWSVDEYLALDTGLLVEYTDGIVRVLAMPSLLHQWIVKYLFGCLNDHVCQHETGEVYFAPLPVKLSESKYREPDIVYVRPQRIATLHGHPTGADLAVEVVSEGKESRDRDYIEKREEYARAGIDEYWIVDPQDKVITVLTLDGSEYRTHGTFANSDKATSLLLSGLEVDVASVFARCEE